MNTNDIDSIDFLKSGKEREKKFGSEVNTEIKGRYFSNLLLGHLGAGEDLLVTENGIIKSNSKNGICSFISHVLGKSMNLYIPVPNLIVITLSAYDDYCHWKRHEAISLYSDPLPLSCVCLSSLSTHALGKSMNPYPCVLIYVQSTMASYVKWTLMLWERHEPMHPCALPYFQLVAAVCVHLTVCHFRLLGILSLIL